MLAAIGDGIAAQQHIFSCT